MSTPWHPRRLAARARLVFTACFALTMLAVGGAAHVRHHLEDPACDSGPAPESHACASCSNLHGGAMAAETPAVVPSPIVWSPGPVAAVVTPPIRAAVADPAPRAPPLA
jgi:hypothetical protein